MCASAHNGVGGHQRTGCCAISELRMYRKTPANVQCTFAWGFAGSGCIGFGERGWPFPELRRRGEAERVASRRETACCCVMFTRAAATAGHQVRRCSEPISPCWQRGQHPYGLAWSKHLGGKSSSSSPRHAAARSRSAGSPSPEDARTAAHPCPVLTAGGADGIIVISL